MEHNSNYGDGFDSKLECTTGQGFPIREDKERKEMGTIESTARTMQRVKNGILTEEDLNQCLEINARNIGMSVEELKEKAEKQLAESEEKE